MAEASGLSTTALAAILSSVGTVLSCALVGILCLLIRAHRTHKRLLKDLEERGIVVDKQRQRIRNDEPKSRPRSVLQRRLLLPYSNQTAWDTLTSQETVRPHISDPILPALPETREDRSHPPKGLWPFGRRPSQSQGTQEPVNVRLSVIAESPRQAKSSAEPVELSTDHEHTRNTSLSHHSHTSSKNEHRPSQDGRSTIELDASMTPEPLFSSSVFRANTTSNTVTPRKRAVPNRANSLAAIPVHSMTGESDMDDDARRRHTRSISLCGPPGHAPEVPVPPLPLRIAKLTERPRSKSAVERSPSRYSISSLESAGSSILTGGNGLMRTRSNKVQFKATGNSSRTVRPRAESDTAMYKARGRSQNSARSNAAVLSLETTPTSKSSPAGSMKLASTGKSRNSGGNPMSAESNRQRRMKSLTPSPATTIGTPKTRRSTVTAFGSPNERKKLSPLRDVSGNERIPVRQDSQTSLVSSTRSSMGNPFQWDPSPLKSSKPSALKGSPTSKGHRRQNCVRLSLAPTVLGPPSRSTSPSHSVMDDIQEEGTDGQPQVKVQRRSGMGFSSTRALPRPPSTSIFAPEVKFNAAGYRSSLTPSSPASSMADYFVSKNNYSPTIGSYYASSLISQRNSARLSGSSAFSIPSFPSPAHTTPQTTQQLQPSDAPTLYISRPSVDMDAEDYTGLASSPGSMTSVHTTEAPKDTTTVTQPTDSKDEYDPTRPGLVFSSANSSPRSSKKRPAPIDSTLSPPSSPKVGATENTGPDFVPLSRSPSPPASIATSITYAASHSSAAFPSTIDPSLLTSTAGASSPTFSTTTTILPTPTFAPATMATSAGNPNPFLTAPTLHPSPNQKPQIDIELPIPGLGAGMRNDMPQLVPAGPRAEPPRPLGRTVAALRRMNSDSNPDHRAGRRYLRMGREATDPNLTQDIDDSGMIDLDAATVDESALGNFYAGTSILGLDSLDDNPIDTSLAAPAWKTWGWSPSLASMSEAGGWTPLPGLNGGEWGPIGSQGTWTNNSSPTLGEGSLASAGGQGQSPVLEKVQEDPEGEVTPTEERAAADEEDKENTPPQQVQETTKEDKPVGEEKQQQQRESKTFSTPTKPKRHSRTGSVIAFGTVNATGKDGSPGSLYDTDGFLKATPRKERESILSQTLLQDSPGSLYDPDGFLRCTPANSSTSQNQQPVVRRYSLRESVSLSQAQLAQQFEQQQQQQQQNTPAARHSLYDAQGFYATPSQQQPTNTKTALQTPGSTRSLGLYDSQGFLKGVLEEDEDDEGEQEEDASPLVRRHAGRLPGVLGVIREVESSPVVGVGRSPVASPSPSPSPVRGRGVVV